MRHGQKTVCVMFRNLSPNNQKVICDLLKKKVASWSKKLENFLKKLLGKQWRQTISKNANKQRVPF